MGRGDPGLERGTLDVAGVRRGYWLARGPGGSPGTLLVVLHGSGTSGKDVAATFTGLAARGPAAGVTTVFPDGWDGVWHIARPPAGEPGLDDAAFLRALVGESGATSVFLAGISNGAGFAEHAARHGLLPLAGLFLVAGTIREFSLDAKPVPRQRTAVTIMSGTGDRAVNYDGGPLQAPGVAGWILRRRARLAGRAAVPADPGHRPHPSPPGRDRHPAENGLTESPPGVSGDAGVSSGLEKRAQPPLPRR